MNKDIFIALCDHLEKEAPSLCWIDEDLGQLSMAGSMRPAVDFPCCLIDIEYSDCQDLTDLCQFVKIRITLKLAFPYQGESYSKAPEKVGKRLWTVILSSTRYMIAYKDGRRTRYSRR